MRLQDQLTATIAERVASGPQPVPNLSDAVRRGRRIRRRRNLSALAVVAVAVTLGGQVPASVVSDLVATGRDRFASVGPLDYTEGLRAFASPDPDGEVSIGGRFFPREAMGHLDTEGTGTAFGLVFFDRTMQAHLLPPDGTDVTLAPAPSVYELSTAVLDGMFGARFRPSAKTDARLPLLAFTQPTGDGVTIYLHDLDTGRNVDTIDVSCSSCEDVRVDGVDRGLVVVRTERGTFVWEPGARGPERWTMLGKGDFRVADVRNGRVLWSGAPPTPATNSPVLGWDFTEGEIDAELSHDGRHILAWSSTLKPTESGGQPITLKVSDALWFTFDTDGSVLAAAKEHEQRSTVYDCELPSGACERIGSVSTRSGDPVFIGNDM